MLGKLAVQRPAPRISDLFSEVLRYVGATLEPGTFAIYSTTFAHFRRSAGNPPLSSLTPRNFDRYKIERLASVAPSTVNIELRTLKSAFRMGVRWNMLRRWPLDGVSIYQISKLLGHSDVKITQKYYAHLEPAELHDVVDRLTFRLDYSPRQRIIACHMLKR